MYHPTKKDGTPWKKKTGVKKVRFLMRNECSKLSKHIHFNQGCRFGPKNQAAKRWFHSPIFRSRSVTICGGGLLRFRKCRDKSAKFASTDMVCGLLPWIHLHDFTILCLETTSMDVGIHGTSTAVKNAKEHAGQRMLVLHWTKSRHNSDFKTNLILSTKTYEVVLVRTIHTWMASQKIEENLS